MINTTHITASINKFNCPIVERETEEEREESGQTSADIRTAAPVQAEFDLFAEARAIYLRARSGGRVRSSSII